MRKLLIVLVVTLGMSCRHEMTNEEIIAQMKLCESAGMRGIQYSSGLGLATVRVECQPIRYCEPTK